MADTSSHVLWQLRCDTVCNINYGSPGGKIKPAVWHAGVFLQCQSMIDGAWRWALTKTRKYNHNFSMHIHSIQRNMLCERNWCLRVTWKCYWNGVIWFEHVLTELVQQPWFGVSRGCALWGHGASWGTTTASERFAVTYLLKWWMIAIESCYIGWQVACLFF